jgi:WD40 repeat protein
VRRTIAVMPMTKLVALKLDGDFLQGIKVTLSIANEGASPYKEVTGNLPPVTELQTKIDQWRSHYRSLGSPNRALKAVKVTYGGSTTERYKDCKNSATELQKRLNNWLRSESFRSIRETWLKELQENESIRVIIRTSNHQLRQIPWHLWDLLDEYPNAELTLGATNYQQPIIAKTPTYRDKVKILAILGNSTGIDVETDRRLLDSLPDADVTFLVQPQRYEINDQLWEKPWDILFFAGHSQTVGDSGRIYINENRESLSIDDLKYGLKKATGNGLALAIFNSCDGLGLASELEALHIPQIIVMREPVPDVVAQAFLKYFLMAYAVDEKPLYQAVKEGRLKLHGLEDKYPCASWLPVICQNGSAVLPGWLDLGRHSTKICPYRGLFAFREKDAEFFWGRESFTQMLVEAVENQPLVAVIGASGSGKSSVVFAGLVKQLRSTSKWQIINFRPGSRPLFALATALVSLQETPKSRPDRLHNIKNLTGYLENFEHGLRDVVDDILSSHPEESLLLIADQFEELYTQCKDAQERRIFLDRLLSVINRCHNFTLVITLRADFVGQVLSYRPFADALQYKDIKLAPMTYEELEAAVSKPAELLGVTIEEGLTERIVSTVNTEPGNLPLLEFALTQLWAKQQNAQLTHHAYNEIGGVEASLASYADKVYNQLNPEETLRAERIFIQMVQPGEGTEDTRRIANSKEIGEENWDLVTRLADARLVVTGRDEKMGLETVEFVHEALIRNWRQLHLWMQEDREFRRWQENLRVVMRTWESSDFDEGALLRGRPLLDAEYWQKQRFLELSAVERSFIGLSLENREGEIKKQKGRRKLTISGLCAGLVIALSLAGVAWWQWQNSIISQIKTTSASSSALFASNQELEGLIAAVKAGQQLKKSPWIKGDTEAMVIDALQNVLYRIKEYNRLEEYKGGVYRVEFSPNGKIVATLGKQGQVKLWKPDGSFLDTPWLSNLKDISAVAISPDNQMIAIASGKKVTIWNLNGKFLSSVEVNKFTITALAISPHNQTIAISTGERVNGQGDVQLWKTNGAFIKTLETRNSFQSTVAFSPDGEMIASGGWLGTLRLWKKDGSFIKDIQVLNGAINAIGFHPNPNSQMIATATVENVKLWKFDGTLVSEMKGHKDSVWGLSFSPNGETIATAGNDKTVKLWKLDGTLVNTLQGHRDIVGSVAISPQGNMIASAGNDGTVKIWKPNNTPLPTLQQGSPFHTVSFSPDGRQIATTSGYKTVTLWNQEGKLLQTGEWHDGTVSGIDFSRDGQMIVTVGGDNFVKLWKSNGTKIIDFPRHTNRFLAVSFSPDSQIIAAASEDKTVKLWKKKATGEFFSDSDVTLRGHGKAVNAVAFSPDGQIIATASNDKTVKLWSTDGAIVKTLSGHTDNVRAVAFSPDGQIIATASNDKTVKLWSTDGAFLKNLTGHRDVVSAIAFSPDGKTLASASKDETVILWNWQENLDLQQLLQLGCHWLGDYLKNNPNINDEDRRLCYGIG